LRQQFFGDAIDLAQPEMTPPSIDSGDEFPWGLALQIAT